MAGRAAGSRRQGRCPGLLATPPEGLGVSAGGCRRGGAGATPLGLSLLPAVPPQQPPASAAAGGAVALLWAAHLTCPWALAGLASPGVSLGSPQAHSSSHSNPDPQAPLASSRSAVMTGLICALWVIVCHPQTPRGSPKPQDTPLEGRASRQGPCRGKREGRGPQGGSVARPRKVKPSVACFPDLLPPQGHWQRISVEKHLENQFWRSRG